MQYTTNLISEQIPSRQPPENHLGSPPTPYCSQTPYYPLSPTYYPPPPSYYPPPPAYYPPPPAYYPPPPAYYPPPPAYYPSPPAYYPPPPHFNTNFSDHKQLQCDHPLSSLQNHQLSSSKPKCWLLYATHENCGNHRENLINESKCKYKFPMCIIFMNNESFLKLFGKKRN